MGPVLLLSSAWLAFEIVVVLLMSSMSHLSCLMFSSLMFCSTSSHSTCAKCLVAATMVSALLTVGIVMYLCLKYTVCNLYASHFFYPNFVAPVMLL